MVVLLETTPKVREDGLLAALAGSDRYIADDRVRRRWREHALALAVASAPPGGPLAAAIERSHTVLLMVGWGRGEVSVWPWLSADAMNVVVGSPRTNAAGGNAYLDRAGERRAVLLDGVQESVDGQVGL